MKRLLSTCRRLPVWFGMLAPLALCIGAGDPEAANVVYSHALTAMSNLPQPAYATYRIESSSEGLQVDLVTNQDQVWLNIHGGSTPARWTLRHRTYDYSTEILNAADGRRLVTQRSFFDPTWYGAYRALREGMFDSQDPAPPRNVSATPSPTPGPSLRTIAVVAVMGPGIYQIQDRGDHLCPTGSPGRALHLVSRTRDPMHQLSDVIVEMQSMRFCMMRFAESSGFGFHGIVEQHYADVGGYWMLTDGFIDGTLRVFGISMHHGIWRYRLLDMQFPASVPAAAFTPGAQ